MAIMTSPEVEKKLERWEEVETQLRNTTRKQRGIHPSERMSLLAMFWWAFLLLMPFDTFNTSASFNTMHEIAEEWVWGVTILGLASFHTSVLWFMKKHSHLLGIRQACIIAGIFAWSFLSFVLAKGNPEAPGWGIYLIFAISQLFALEVTFERE